MKKHLMVIIIFSTLIGSFLLLSGCTQQNNQPSTESIQTILQKGTLVDSVYYELEISTIISGSIEQLSTLKIWQKTPYIKEEVNTTAGGMTTNETFIIRPDEGIYRYNPIPNTYSLYPGIFSPQPTIAKTIEDLLSNQTLTVIGNETIDGKAATIIQYTPSQTGNSTTMTLWIWNEKGVPLKAQQITTNEQTTVTINEIFRNYSFADISESTFSVE
jgi:outer membrane lipoprotein-sorting protein